MCVRAWLCAWFMFASTSLGKTRYVSINCVSSAAVIKMRTNKPNQPVSSAASHHDKTRKTSRLIRVPSTCWAGFTFTESMPPSCLIESLRQRTACLASGAGSNTTSRHPSWETKMFRAACASTSTGRSLHSSHWLTLCRRNGPTGPKGGNGFLRPLVELLRGA